MLATLVGVPSGAFESRRRSSNGRVIAFRAAARRCPPDRLRRRGLRRIRTSQFDVIAQGHIGHDLSDCRDSGIARRGNRTTTGEAPRSGNKCPYADTSDGRWGGNRRRGETHRFSPDMKDLRVRTSCATQQAPPPSRRRSKRPHRTLTDLGAISRRVGNDCRIWQGHLSTEKAAQAPRVIDVP